MALFNWASLWPKAKKAKQAMANEPGPSAGLCQPMPAQSVHGTWLAHGHPPRRGRGAHHGAVTGGLSTRESCHSLRENDLKCTGY
jgi:hypothetical protein